LKMKIWLMLNELHLQLTAGVAKGGAFAGRQFRSNLLSWVAADKQSESSSALRQPATVWRHI
jgi:hypothetical protein